MEDGIGGGRRRGRDYKLGLMGFEGGYDLYRARDVEFGAAKRCDIHLQREHLEITSNSKTRKFSPLQNFSCHRA